MPLLRAAGEYCLAADARPPVGEHPLEPRPHRLGQQVLLGDRAAPVDPAAADRLERRLHDLLDRARDRVQRERLLDERGEYDRIAGMGRLDQRVAQLARGGDRDLAGGIEQGRGFGDAEALREPVAQPLDAGDVAVVVAALAAGRPVRSQDAVAPLPLAQRVGGDARPPGDRGDVEPARLLRGSVRTGVDVRHHGPAEILEHADVEVGPRMRPQVDRAERADRVTGRGDERDAQIGDDVEVEQAADVVQQRMRAGVREHDRLARAHRVLAERARGRHGATIDPVALEPGHADERLAVRPDERQQRDRDLEQRRDERGQPVEDGAVGGAVEPESLKRLEARGVVETGADGESPSVLHRSGEQ